MFREMRNKKREISTDEAKKILSENAYGVLSTINSDNSYPYGIPISYSYVNEKIYLHSAKEGLKIDSFLKIIEFALLLLEKRKFCRNYLRLNMKAL